MGLPSLSYRVPFAAYEFDGDKVDVVNGMAAAWLKCNETGVVMLSCW